MSETNWLYELIERSVWDQIRIWVLNHIPVNLKSKISAADIIQSAFRLAMSKQADCRGTSTEEREAWFRSIVHNKLVSTIRAFQTKARRVDKEVTFDDEDACETQDIVGLEVVRRETVRIVRDVLGNLPGDDMTIIDMKFRRGMTRQQIATELDIPLGQAGGRERRALENVRKALQSSELI